MPGRVELRAAATEPTSGRQLRRLKASALRDCSAFGTGPLRDRGLRARVAHRLAANGAPLERSCSADTQTRGPGRGGKRWISPRCRALADSRCAPGHCREAFACSRSALASPRPETLDRFATGPAYTGSGRMNCTSPAGSLPACGSKRVARHDTGVAGDRVGVNVIARPARLVARVCGPARRESRVGVAGPRAVGGRPSVSMRRSIRQSSAPTRAATSLRAAATAPGR